ncbi:Uncharacterised protein [Mycobacteroides abscessus subsp. abscessus]|nr:Uncharacterised protein [Mycobacteroides abscessus subsp. abscessus]
MIDLERDRLDQFRDGRGRRFGEVIGQIDEIAGRDLVCTAGAGANDDRRDLVADNRHAQGHRPCRPCA